jgi:poly(beta-D-mannuronate) lyase
MQLSIVKLLVVSLIIAEPLFGKEFHASDDKALNAAISSAQPGDVILLSEGDWHDVKVIFTGEGLNTAPITLRARTPGKTVFSGSSTLRIGGSYLIVEGLHFQDPDSSISDLIQFRKDSKQLAQHCRMTNCSVACTQIATASKESRWVGLYGVDNRVDRCSFSGKSGKGTTFVVWLGGTSQGKHQIDHNYFGPREALGANGGETIRIGDSETSMLEADCVVEHNLFEKCNGEAECISNKSCGNVYRENTFLEVSGTLTLRHGNRCVVEKNVFLGNNAKGTGGIRIIGEDHVVRGNYLERLTGDDARSAISLMMGIPNSPANRYFQVQRAVVENNMIVDCKHPILIGLSDAKDASLAPIDSKFIGNQASCPKYTIVEARCKIDGIAWTENRFLGKALGIDLVSGIATTNPMIASLKPIARSLVGPTWTQD